MIEKSGEWRVEKIEYPDGVGGCIWKKEFDEEDFGICIDFAEEDIDDMIKVLQKFKEMKATTFKEET